MPQGRKRSPENQKIIDLIQQGVSNKDILAITGCKLHTLHNRRWELKRLAEKASRQAKAVRVARQTTTPVQPLQPEAKIHVTIDPKEVVSIQLRSPDNQGTLWVGNGGVAYSRPNQKSRPTAILSFEKLAQLVDSGLFS